MAWTGDWRFHSLALVAIQEAIMAVIRGDVVQGVFRMLERAQRDFDHAHDKVREAKKEGGCSR